MQTKAFRMLQYGWQDQPNTLEAIRAPYNTLYKQVLNWHRLEDGKASVQDRLYASATE